MAIQVRLDPEGKEQKKEQKKEGTKGIRKKLLEKKRINTCNFYQSSLILAYSPPSVGVCSVVLSTYLVNTATGGTCT